MMNVRKIYESELLEAHRISALSFHWPLDDKGKTPEEYGKSTRANPSSKGDSAATDVWGAFTDEGTMMACLCVIPYQVAFDGHTVPMGGIGGVCTYPEHRRKGAVKGMFLKFLDELYEKKAPFSYLYPFSEQFYGSFGYHRSCTSVFWEFDLKAIPGAPIPGTFHLYRPGAAMDDFKAAYQAFAHQWNMMVSREELDWTTVKNADPFKGEVHAFLYKDPTGKPAGYLVFEKRTGEHGRRILGGKEIAFDSFETLKAIMAFAKTFAADYEAISFNAPATLNLGYFCADFPQSQTSRRVYINGMARAVHVQEVLKLARYQGSGSLSLYMHDASLPKNNGLYHVRFEEDKAVEIGFSPLPVSPFGQTGQTVDVEMTVNVFSSAILGNYHLADFEYMDGVKINTNRESAGRVFYAKPCWINNFF